MNDKQIENLRKMIQKETISLPGNTDVTKFLEFHKLLEELFPNLWRVAEVEEIHGSLLIRWPGKSSDNPRLMMSHHDVVEENGIWTEHKPFSADIADGRLWGRGTLDTKGFLWALLQSADDLIAEGFVPKSDIYFESGNDEELGGKGAKAISEVLRERNIHFSYIIDEGGFIVGNSANIGVGEKAVNEIKFIAKSSGGHASMPPKNGPLVRLGRFMAYVDDNYRDLFPVEIEPVTNSKQATTIAFTMANGALAKNVLPREAYIITSVRVAHHQGVENTLKVLEDTAKQFDIEMEVLEKGFETKITDTANPVFKEVAACIEESFPGVSAHPYILMGATDTRYMNDLSDVIIRFCPFKVDMAQIGTVHSANENVYIDSLEPALNCVKKMMQK